MGAVISTAQKWIPRGNRKIYTPGLNVRSDELYEQYAATSDQQMVNKLPHSPDAAKHESWMNIVENIDFKRSSRKVWSLLRKLNGDNICPPSRIFYLTQ